MDKITSNKLTRNFFIKKLEVNKEASREIPKTKKSNSMLDSEIFLSFIYAGIIAKNTPKLILQNNKMAITVGNFIKCFADEIEIIPICTVLSFLDNANEKTSEVAIENAAIWKIILYETSKFSSKNEPIRGPIISPTTKNAMNWDIAFTRFCGVVDWEMIDSQGGQKNECATPTRVLKIITWGTESATESKYIDSESITSPKERSKPLLNLSSNNPTKSGMNM